MAGCLRWISPHRNEVCTSGEVFTIPHGLRLVIFTMMLFACCALRDLSENRQSGSYNPSNGLPVTLLLVTVLFLLMCVSSVWAGLRRWQLDSVVIGGTQPRRL